MAAIAAIFAVATVWHPTLEAPGGYGWIIGAALGAVPHMILAKKTA